MNDNLKFLSWNANDLEQHKHELNIILVNHKIDILLIWETHFRKLHTISKLFRLSHIHPDESVHGGTTVIIKNTIKDHFTTYLNKYLQATNVVIEIG